MNKEKVRNMITDDLLEYCIENSPKLIDRRWSDLLNAITRMPHNGRLLKVVYKQKGKTIKIVTAYWLD
ncbi:MAG TPA: hypothetical protein VJC07_04920 [Candidatus Nanoarchaeia archaeon]|nr:hypothetical protein [Candidatus Nanoarchaeia archaeon]